MLRLFYILISSLLILNFSYGSKNEDINKKLTSIKLPFIKNEGQVNKEVKFYAKTFGGTLFVTKDGKLVYSLPKYKNKKLQGGVALREILKGAKIKEVKGLEKATAKVNYFTGKDPSKWRTNIETYNMVSLGEVYKGIELELRAYGKNVEKIFKVKPKSNPEKIVLKVEGAKELKIDKETGELIAKTELGDVRFTRPVAYQEIKGKRVNVEVKYKLFSKDSYGFEVGKYDRTKSLIIDPLLASTFVGGDNSDVAGAMALDTNSVYIVGKTGSPNYPTTPGAYDNSYNSSSTLYNEFDVFISRFDKDLTTLEASTFIGGSYDDVANAIALDTNSVYITGYTSSSDYPTTSGAYNTSHNNNEDVFISRFDKDLTTLEASTFIGGIVGAEEALAIALDTDSVYIAGWTRSPDYPATSGAYNTSHNGGIDAFISRFDKDLTTLEASTFIGRSGNDVAITMALDIDSIYIAGWTGSSNYPTTPGAYDSSYNGGSEDAFISRFDKDLTTLEASTFIGGDDDERVHAIAIDTNSVYIAGGTYSSDYPTTPGAYDNSHNGNSDAFISRFDKNLTTLQASTFIGGSNDDTARVIAIDTSSVYIAGNTIFSFLTNYPTTPGAYDNSHNGNSDAFISRFDKNLTTLQASTFIGGSYDDVAWTIAIDTSSVYIAGGTYSSDYPTTPGAYDNSHNGSYDVFISRLDKNLSTVTVQYTLTINKTGAGSGTVTSNPAGINCGIDCSENYNQGTVVTLTATPDVGSVFAGWSGDCSSCGNNTTCNVTMDTDKTCTAQFDPAPNNPPVINSFTANPSSGNAPLTTVFDWNVSDPDGDTLTCHIDVDNDGINEYTINDCANNTSQNHTYNTAGNYIARLTVDDGNGGTASQTVNVTVTSITQYTLTVNKTGAGSGTVTSNPAGINCGIDCSENYNQGTVVTLTATPDVGSVFAGWSGDCSSCGNNTTCNVTMDTDKTCTAQFDPTPNNPPVINSFTANPNSGNAPLTTVFDWNVSDPDGDTLTCHIDVDNDGINEYTINDCANNTSQNHTYNTAGNYIARLTVDDGNGGTASQTVNVVVSAQQAAVQNGRMFGYFTLGNWPNFAAVDTNITCNGSITPWFSLDYFDGSVYHVVVAYSPVSVLCYDDPAFTPANPTVLFDSTEAQLTGMMDGYIPVRVEVVLKDGGEPGYGRDYAEITVRDMSNTIIYQTGGYITSGSIYAMPLY